MTKEIMVMLISTVPVLELRWAIPQALYWGMPYLKAFYLAVLGNCLIVAPILLLFAPVSGFLRKFKPMKRFFDWLDARTRKKADVIQKYEALGLALFVAIPLPGTGAWTGCFAASLFKIKFRYAFISILAGVITAGIIVSVLCMVGKISIEALIK